MILVWMADINQMMANLRPFCRGRLSNPEIEATVDLARVRRDHFEAIASSLSPVII